MVQTAIGAIEGKRLIEKTAKLGKYTTVHASVR